MKKIITSLLFIMTTFLFAGCSDSTSNESIGIKDILSYYDIKQEETMAFGDGENDIDMLRFVQIGVAMQNAENCVKEAADYITDTSENDGIYKALKHFNIL